MRFWHAWLALGLLLSCGCNTGRAFIASPGDYADYRRVRVAETADERLARAWYYLQERRDGRYAERLGRYFARAEPVFYRVRRRSARGLEAYLLALPNGPHAEAALSLLMELRVERRREELDTRKARETGLRLDLERDKRAAAAELLGFWLTQLLEAQVWQLPLSQAPGELLVRYIVALPTPSCEPRTDELDGRRCIKTVARRFRVSREGKHLARELAFDLELELDGRGRLVHVTLIGSALFVRTLEAREQRALDDSAEEAKRAANEFVAWLTAALVERDVACNGGSDPDGTINLDCEGLLLTIEPGIGGGDDVVLIARPAGEPTPEEEEDEPDEEPPFEEEEADGGEPYD